jgi:hypothetical protein
MFLRSSIDLLSEMLLLSMIPSISIVKGPSSTHTMRVELSFFSPDSPSEPSVSPSNSTLHIVRITLVFIIVVHVIFVP